MSALELAAWIDEQFLQAWKDQAIEPAPLTNDSEYVRRAFLDLIGRIPSVAEVRAFLDDDSPDKRRVLVDELLQRGAFASHLANTFRDLMLAGTSAPETRRARSVTRYLAQAAVHGQHAVRPGCE